MGEDYFTEEDAKELFMKDVLNHNAENELECHTIDFYGRRHYSNYRYHANGIDLSNYPWQQWMVELEQQGLMVSRKCDVSTLVWWRAATPHEIASFMMSKKNAEG